jgi:hypothetical protein
VRQLKPTVLIGRTMVSDPLGRADWGRGLFWILRLFSILKQAGNAEAQVDPFLTLKTPPPPRR